MTELLHATDPDQPTAEVWEIPRRVYFILLSWGLAVLLLAGLLSFWIYSNQRHSEHLAAQAKIRQDRAMCAMIDVFLQGPDAPAGPAGDRSRSVRAGMLNYQAVLGCDRLGS
jgi:hypothetical protein